MILVPQTNNRIKGGPLYFGELLHLHDYGSSLPLIQDKIEDVFADNFIDIFEGTPVRLNIYMIGNIFKNIISTFSFTDILPPYFKDKFFEVRQIVFAWN